MDVPILQMSRNINDGRFNIAHGKKYYQRWAFQYYTRKEILTTVDVPILHMGRNIINGGQSNITQGKKHYQTMDVIILPTERTINNGGHSNITNGENNNDGLSNITYRKK